MWSANRRQKLRELERIYEDVEQELQDADGSTPAARHKNRHLLVKIIHDMNEMTGQLQVRSVVEVATAMAASARGPSRIPELCRHTAKPVTELRKITCDRGDCKARP
jgi:hypothetical protein